ncbi:Early nodulin-like protein 2, partial [Mucuna pruriens]
LHHHLEYTFHVGGKYGWVIKPSEDYTVTGPRETDFKYKKRSDSVLVVNKEDYDSCKSKNPIQKMDDGDSTFMFDKSGPFFFINGNVQNCQRDTNTLSPSPSPAEAETPTANAPSPAEAEAPSAAPPFGLNCPSPSPAKHSGSTRFRGSVGAWSGFVLQHLG